METRKINGMGCMTAKWPLDPARATLVFIHGAGGAGTFWQAQVEGLAGRVNTLALDLPGHGSLVVDDDDDNGQEELTLDNCVATIYNIVVEQEKCDPSQTIYVGTSLGGYVGFYVLDKMMSSSQYNNFSFAGAILMSVGQNVGPDCSTKAKCGLW